MQDYMYAVIGSLAVIVQLILNYRVMFLPAKGTAGKAADKYRQLLLAFLAYYVTDVLWGILAGLNRIPLLFADTTVYFAAMGAEIFCFNRYIVDYLELDGWRARAFHWYGGIFLVLLLGALVANFFVPCLFWFDANDVYVAGPLRYAALWIQVAMFAFSSVVTLLETIKTRDSDNSRHLAIFFFSLTMLAAILFQEKFPLLPFYALGGLLGSCVLHVYVVGDEREEYQRRLLGEKEKLEESSTQLANYKRAVLADALISLEVNLNRDEIYYGVWKNDVGKEVPLEDILGMTLPCSYDEYIKAWNRKYVRENDERAFSGKTDREHLLEVFRRGEPEITFDYQARTISGRSAWLRRSIAMIRNQTGDVISFTSVKDITPLVEQTKREEAYIRALATEYDSIAVVSLEADKLDDRVVLHSRLSPGIAALIDNETANEPCYSRKLGLMARFLHPEDRERFLAETRREVIMKAFIEERTSSVDFRIMKPDGSGDYFYYQIRFVPIRDDSGNIERMIACMRSIDAEIRRELGARRELEKAIIDAEAANRAKSTFLFNMSHDIRTPMNAIIGFTDIAEKHIDDTERVRDSLRKVRLSSDHLLTLVNDVLDMSRVESGTVNILEEPVCIDMAKDNLFSLLNGSAQDKGITFTSVIAPSVAHRWVYTDRLQMMRVLTNIVSNSVKYTDPGGRIDLTAEELPCEREGYAHLRYTVTDNGIGMSEEFLKTIYEPFSRAESATRSGIIGTGLGMSITKALVEKLGGTITIESEPGAGTTVRLDFENRIAEPVSPQKDMPKNVMMDLSGKKVLLVEDNELNREIAVEILEEEGIEVDTAEDGSVAVEKLAAAEPGRYDLVLMDIQMPIMNGYDATRAIRALENSRAASIPIIAMTANAFEEDRKNAFEAGMNGHLAKPIEIPKLLAALTEILG